MSKDGYNKLWGWFGLSYASFLTIPRTLMHEMPDKWQGKMADLLAEYDQTFPGTHREASPYVIAKKDNRFCRWPSWLLNYRHPDKESINELRKP